MTEENKTPEVDYKAAFETQKSEMEVSTAKLADLQNQLNSVLAHNEKVLGEKKAEQAKRTQAEEDKARKAGDFEQLLKSSEDKNLELQEQFKALNSRIAGEQVQNHAMKMSLELADGSNAELLSTFISQRLKTTDAGVKVLDKDGQLTVSTLEDLKNEFLSNERYKALLRGIQSTGGGASGSGSGAGAVKEMKRAEWDKLDVAAQYKFISTDKGKLVD